MHHLNRWGTKIYEWNNVKEGWDGRNGGGNLASEGTYYYLVEITGQDGRKFKQGGFVMLFR